MNFIVVSIVALACVAAAVFDVRTRRIPNWLTFGLAAAGLIAAAIAGWHLFGNSLLAFVAIFAAGAVVFSMHWLGGGDVKLLAAVAAWVGLPDAVGLALFTAVSGGLLALAWLAGGKLRGNSVAESKRAKMPYALAILAGFSVLVLSKTWIPALRLPL